MALVNIISNKGMTNQDPFALRQEAFEVVRIRATAADTAYIDMHPLLRSGFQLGPTIQAGKGVGGTIAVYLTLDPYELAMDPSKDSFVAWGAVINLAVGGIQSISPVLCTVMKVVFAAANTFTIASM